MIRPLKDRAAKYEPGSKEALARRAKAMEIGEREAKNIKANDYRDFHAMIDDLAAATGESADELRFHLMRRWELHLHHQNPYI